MIVMKKRTASSREAHHLPIDLWREILVMVPVEDLVRMQFVCKSLHDLITRSRSFERSHTDRWRSRACRRPGFVVCPRFNSALYRFYGRSDRASYLTFVSASGGWGAKGLTTRSLGFHLRRDGLEDSPEVIASCDRLMLLGYHGTQELKICNPFTGSRANLPPPPPQSADLLSARKGFLGDHHEDWAIVPDTAPTGRYKILAITSKDGFSYFSHPHEGHGLGLRGTRVRCLVFCLHRSDELPGVGKESEWKELEMQLLEGSWKMERTTHRGGKFRILFSGREYDDRTRSRMSLLSLDIADEAFRHSDPFEARPRGSSSSPDCGGDGHMSAWDGGFYYFEQSCRNRLRLWELGNLDGDLPRWIPRLSVPSGIPSRQIHGGGKPLLVVDGTRLIFGVGGGRSFYVYDMILKEWGSVETDRNYADADADKFLPQVYSLSMSSRICKG